MVDILSVNYNLTNLTSISIMDNPGDFLGFWNQALNGFGIFTIVGIIGLVLFLSVRRYVDSDTEALSYAGYITTFLGLMLFLVQTSDGTKLLGWGYLVIIILVTAIASYLNFVNRRI